MPTITKTLSYGAMHMIVAFAVAYLITGHWQLALGISLIEPIVQTFFYSVHETAWAKKTVKKAKQPDHTSHAGFYY